MAQTVAEALEKKLVAADTSIHWVTVIGEANSWNKPKVVWPVEPEPMFGTMVHDGGSEGTMVLVYAFASRYEPQNVTPLLRIKMLGGRKKVGSELHLIMEFLDDVQGELDQLAAVKAQHKEPQPA